ARVPKVFHGLDPRGDTRLLNCSRYLGKIEPLGDREAMDDSLAAGDLLQYLGAGHPRVELIFAGFQFGLEPLPSGKQLKTPGVANDAVLGEQLPYLAYRRSFGDIDIATLAVGSPLNSKKKISPHPQQQQHQESFKEFFQDTSPVGFLFCGGLSRE